MGAHSGSGEEAAARQTGRVGRATQMLVVAKGLTDEVSITLLEDVDGWRFVSWCKSAHLGGERFPPPHPEVLARRFATQEEALTYFRALAEVRLPSARVRAAAS
jgi:hypothetical protein